MAAYSTSIQAFVDEAYGLVNQVLAQADTLTALYALERDAFHQWQEALSGFDAALDGAIARMDWDASINKEGPLAGIARTSDAYKLAVKAQRAALADKEHAYEHGIVMKLESRYQEASLVYEQAKIKMGALRTVAELQSSALRALAA